jgi:transposase
MQQFNIRTEEKRMGRPLAIKPIDAIVWGLYQHQSTRATKKSVWNDFKDILKCSYKTFVEAINRASLMALLILKYFMSFNQKNQNLVKYTDATDIPVCLAKNAKHHRTMRDFASWGHSGKGFYYGLKLTITRDAKGRLLNICFSSGNANDRDLFRKINKYINGIIVADAGYVSKQLEKDMNTDDRWVLIKPYASMRKLATTWQLALYKKRFDIEFDFRNMKMFHGLVTSLPRSTNGYVANYLYAILSFVLA